MKVYCDTSGLYALLDADSHEHLQAVAIWERLRAERHELVCANYVLVECLTSRAPSCRCSRSSGWTPSPTSELSRRC